jgi:hypothetical protein
MVKKVLYTRKSFSTSAQVLIGWIAFFAGALVRPELPVISVLLLAVARVLP